MMSRTSPLRWLAALLLLMVLATGTVAAVTAQEDFGSPTATSTAEVQSQVSIGDESTNVIATQDATPTQIPGADSQDTGDQTSVGPTETDVPVTETDTPADGIGGEDNGGVSTGDEGSPVAEDTPTETATDEPSASPTPSPTPDETVEAASVASSVIVYLCDSTYTGGDPAGNPACAGASGVDVGAVAGDVDLGVKTTDGAGSVTFDAPENSQVTFTEVQSTVPSGYVPDGNGTAVVAAGSSGSIVNIQVETAGRLQISNGQCPTSGQARTDYIVVGPFAVQSAALGCEPRGGTTLTVTGPGGTYTALTDSQGNWVGTLPVGTYSISNGSGSQSLDVEAGSTTVVIVVDYVPGPKGTLVIERYDCSEGNEGTTIAIDGGPTNDSCLPSDKSVAVTAASGGAPLAIDLGEDGTTSVDVAAGEYEVTDGPTGASLGVQVPEGGSVKVTINSTLLTGSVTASMFWCNSSVSSSVNPANLGNWANGCSRVGSGLVLSLFDSDGNLVSTAGTNGNGGIEFAKLQPGRYTLTASSGCALFANGADARNGFDIVAGGSVEIVAFGCEAPSNVPENPTDPGPDPGTIGGGAGAEGPGSVGDNGGYAGGLDNDGYHTRNLSANPLSSVSTLPATGEGSNDLSDRTLLMLLGLAALCGGAALQVTSRRGKSLI